MKVEVNEIELYYEKFGAGEPILLLHGNGEDHNIFSALAEKLKNNFKVYALDSRNHGESSRTDDFGYETMMEDVYLFITKLKLGKVNVIGFSDGGIISLLLAMKHEEVINKMVVMGANLKPEDFTQESFEYVKQTYEETKDPLFKLMLEEPNIELEELRNINIPSLIIGAENDIYKPELFENIAKTIKGSKLIIMKEHDHGSYIMGKDLLFEDLFEFFGGKFGGNNDGM